MANTTKGYIGRIGNGGAQEVKAPAAKPAKKGNKSVIRGNDLRNGRGK